MNETAYWVALRRIPGLGPLRFRRLIEHYGSAQSAWKAEAKELHSIPGFGSRLIQTFVHHRTQIDVAREWDVTKKKGITVLRSDQPEYPCLLKNIYDPPPVLFVLGSLPINEPRLLAIVGSRQATVYGRTVAKRLAQDLAQAEVGIVSGLARGIDTAAHEGALSSQGKTIAVLGCGVDVVYPPENQKLYARIMESGALVSEHPPGTAPQAKHFPARNRIISGLCQGIVVIEARLDSGALITANAALEQGREVMAVPGPIMNPNSQGVHRLIKDGAPLVESASDIMQCMNWLELDGSGHEEPAWPESRRQLTLEERLVLEVLTLDAKTVDQIHHESGLPLEAILSALLLLEMSGTIQRIPGPRYLRSLLLPRD